MTLRKASTLVHFTASFVAAAMLFSAHPVSAMPALSLTGMSTQQMAAAGSDATANAGVALTSILRREWPVYSAAALAKAASTCTRTAALCEKPSPSIVQLKQIRDCLTCKNSCELAFDLVHVSGRNPHDMINWFNLTEACIETLRKLMNGPQHSVRDGTPTM